MQMTWDPWCATGTCSQGGAAENSPNCAESKVATPCNGAGVHAVRKGVFQNLILASPQLPDPPGSAYNAYLLGLATRHEQVKQKHWSLSLTQASFPLPS